jgi:hypothetical protein
LDTTAGSSNPDPKRIKEAIEMKVLMMFTKRRLKWNRPLDLSQFDGTPS